MKSKGFELIDEGLQHRQNGNYDLALKSYDQAIALGDDLHLAKAYYNKGVLLEQNMNNISEAEKAYPQCVKQDPGHTRAWSNLGNALASADRYEEALNAYEQSLALVPGETIPLFGKAYALNRLGRFQESLPILKSIEQDGEFNDKDRYLLYSELGLALLQNEYLADAAKTFEKSYAFNPAYYQTCFNMAFVADKLQQYEKALLFYDKAIALDKAERKGYNGKACTYIHMKDYQQALPLIQKAIGLLPDHFEGYYNLACIYVGLQDKQGIFEAVRKTIDLAPPAIGIIHHILRDSDFAPYTEEIREHFLM